MIRGKIKFGATLKRNFFKQPRVFCEYDELSHNVLHNMIIKSTIKNIMHCEGITDEVNNELKNVYFKLHYVDEIKLTKNLFRRINLHRNNHFYDFLLKVCELIFDNLLLEKGDGSKKFKDFIQDETIMRSIFEEFIRNFYKKHLPLYKVGRTNINWRFDVLTDESRPVLPQMQTDITLESKYKKIIIEAKYYKEALGVNYNKKKLNSSNLYQLFSYLINQENQNDLICNNCEGILLYPTVHSNYNYQYKFIGHKISVMTINLNQSWKQIENDLLTLVN
ncbi:MAG: hypothetical protein A2Y10_14055 [Planctomycetes bacterium GWF2_41_51]|nr:MAG: hypothetical protein A2Y10_14055 [Planctomycetes bacterium GWF2_41_51]